MNYETPLRGESIGEYSADRGVVGGDQQIGFSRRAWLIALIIFLVIAAIIAVLMVRGMNAVVPATDDDSQLPLVTVVAPGTTTIAGEIEATGTLAARRPVPVGSVGEGGRVTSVPVDAGDWVRQGQVLAVIDRSVQIQQTRSANAQIEVARSDADLAQANLDRALMLVERGFISQADIDRLTATRNSARARVSVAEAQAAELQARTARLNIYAPSSGLVLERNVEPGQTVGGNSGALFIIARGGEMELLAEVGETELAQISVGVSAEVVPVGLDRIFTGQVWQLAPTINQNDRQGTARIALPYDRALRPGGFATVRIASGTIVAPKLPESAIQSDNDGAYVYIIDGDNKVVRRPVTTGLVSEDGIAIADGLDGSERVVMFAGGFLNPGETVRVNTQSDRPDDTGKDGN